MTDSARTEEIRARVAFYPPGSNCDYCYGSEHYADDVPYLLTELTALREENERLKGALTSANPFSGGRDGDVCLWCNRDQPREWSEFSELFLPDNHDADCQLIAALSPSPAQEEKK